VLAAIVYAQGFPINDLMLDIAAALRKDGVRVGGVMQENAGQGPCAAMSVVDLVSGERFAISQELGAGSRGCRLDPRGLAEVAARTDATMGADFDLLLLNKFGRAEAEGGGLRSVLTRAIAAGTPVLTSVRPPYVEAWTAFHGGLAAGLPPRLEDAVAWCRRAIGEQRDGEAAGRSCNVAVPS
jgi:nucleoside-triphosphatase THEP1